MPRLTWRGVPTTPSPGWSPNATPAVPGPGRAGPRLVDEFLPKIEEWVEKSNGKIRADVAHDKLVAMGFPRSERSSHTLAVLPPDGSG